MKFASAIIMVMIGLANATASGETTSKTLADTKVVTDPSLNCFRLENPIFMEETPRNTSTPAPERPLGIQGCFI